MEINTLNKEVINRRKYAAANGHEIPQNPYHAYKKGWEDAIKFAQRVNRSIAICTQCGKLIEHDNDYRLDAAGAEFCSKCYQHLFEKEVSK